jgi:hypothetical protein
MTLLSVPPRFQPRPRLSETGWEIVVTWPDDSRTDFVVGFASEREAEDWIDKESASWEYHHRKK